MPDGSFDSEFDVASDAGGRDPDTSSPRLHAAHLALWSRPRPNGQLHELFDARPDGYLRLHSDEGTFDLCSDSIIHTYRRDGLRQILDALEPAELDAFVRVAHMIGGYIVWPIGNGRTINQVRGFDKKKSIDDRFDLTLECIRMHYLGEASELSEVLGRYDAFFKFFGSFPNYVSYFLLQDLVDDDAKSVRFFLDDGFNRPALPQTTDEYRTYAERATRFVRSRNDRMRRALAI